MATPDDGSGLAPESIVGLDPEMRQFMARLMTGYESMTRAMRDMAESAMARARDAEAIAAKSLQVQVQMAADREELVSRRHKRELETYEAQARVEMMGEVKGKLVAILPLIVKRLAGIPLTGDDSHGLNDLLASLSGDQVAKLVGEGTLQLDEAQRTLLMQTLGSLAEAEKKSLPASPEKTEAA